MSSNLLEIKEKAGHTLKTATEWQLEQKHRDELINKKINMQSEHIRCKNSQIALWKMCREYEFEILLCIILIMLILYYV